MSQLTQQHIHTHNCTEYGLACTHVCSLIPEFLQPMTQSLWHVFLFYYCPESFTYYLSNTWISPLFYCFVQMVGQNIWNWGCLWKTDTWSRPLSTGVKMWHKRAQSSVSCASGQAWCSCQLKEGGSRDQHHHRYTFWVFTIFREHVKCFLFAISLSTHKSPY